MSNDEPDIDELQEFDDDDIEEDEGDIAEDE